MLTHIPTFIKLKANVNSLDESPTFICTRKINKSLIDLSFDSNYSSYRFLKKDKFLVKNLIRINDSIDNVKSKYKDMRNLFK